MHGEPFLAPLGRQLPDRRPHGPLERRAGAGGRARRRRTRGARAGAGRSARRSTSRPAAATSARTAARSNWCRCPIRADSARLAGRRPERLSSSGTSTSTRRGDPRGLAQQRQRVRDVLEHVREHRQVVRAVRRRDVRAVVGLEPAGAREPACAGDLDRRRRRARSRRSAPAARHRASSASSAPSPQPISTTVAGSGRHSASARAWAAFVRAPSSRQRPELQALLAVGERVARGVERRGVVAGLHGASAAAALQRAGLACA